MPAKNDNSILEYEGSFLLFILGIIVLVGFLCLAAVGLSSCLKPKPQATLPPTTQKDVCTAANPDPIPGSCGSVWSKEGWLYALCHNSRDCVDARTFTWCVTDCDDLPRGILQRGE
jgi:hypothetical protein